MSSLEGLIHYLGLHTTPADPAYCPQHRAQLCYLAHLLSLVLKRSNAASEHWPPLPVLLHTYIYTYMYMYMYTVMCVNLHVHVHLHCYVCVRTCIIIIVNFPVHFSMEKGGPLILV